MTGNRGRGRKGAGGGMGAGGNCVCVKCGYSTSKITGIPCKQEKCPRCGAVLLREGSKHYQDAIKKKVNYNNF